MCCWVPSKILWRRLREESGQSQVRKCFGKEDFIKIIAWIEIIGYLLMLSYLAYAVTLLLEAGPEKVSELLHEIPELQPLKENAYSLLILCFLVAIAVCVLGSAMGLVLLKGVNQKNPKFLRIWVIYSFCMCCLTLLATLQGEMGPIAFGLGFRLFAASFFYGFFTAKVLEMIREIQQGTNQDVLQDSQFTCELKQVDIFGVDPFTVTQHNDKV